MRCTNMGVRRIIVKGKTPFLPAQQPESGRCVILTTVFGFNDAGWIQAMPAYL